MRRVLVATRNPGKLQELMPLLLAEGVQAVDLATAGIPETSHEGSIELHDSFEANALAKARHFHSISGLPTLAEDSGLCVRALGGQPGVRSKRWSGRVDLQGAALDAANNAHLLLALAGAVGRSASYVCAAAYVDAEREIVRRGETEGRILEAPLGAAGFGYDPYFWSRELGRGFAEVSRAEKSAVSHRGRAVSTLLAALRSDASGRLGEAGR